MAILAAGKMYNLSSKDQRMVLHGLIASFKLAAKYSGSTVIAMSELFAGKFKLIDLYQHQKWPET